MAETNDHLQEQLEAAGVLTETAATEVRRRAFLHDDPAAYRAGVHDALAAVAAHLLQPDDEDLAQGG